VQKAGGDTDPVPPMTALRDVLQKLDEKDVELAQARFRVKCLGFRIWDLLDEKEVEPAQTRSVNQNRKPWV